MVTAAGEGTTSSAYGGGGGAGGKFRKRPLRKSQTTPYDRPPTAFRNPSWLSKLVVEPASKLISAGAHRFFSTVFRKRLTSSPHPSPQPPEEKQESRNGHHETVPDNHARPQEPEKIVGVSSKRKSDTTTNGISELEQLLSEKSFTKSEIACLTELLQSRAVDSPVKDDGIMSEANLSIQNNFSKPTSDTRKRQEFSIPPEGNKIEIIRANGALTTPTLSKTNEKYQLLEDDIAAPAELAKAYMGSRSSKVSPSKLGMRSQIAREDAVLFNNSIFSPKSPMTLENTGHVGPSRNGFTTPRSLGRSAIYNMARTPYSRVPTSIQKASGSRNFEYGGTSSSPSQSMWESSGGLVSFRPASLKRRSSVFDEDIGGSVGPIRRIRQKSNLSSNRTSLTSRGTNLASDSSQLHKQETENRVSNARSKDYSQIPRASSEMAARIFEQLDKMTPKEKSSESKLAAAKGASSFKLTTNMLHGQALSSMENLDASKLMQNSLIEHKLEVNQPIKSLPDPHESTTTTNHKQSRVEENGPAKIVNPPSTEDTPKPKFTPQLSEPKFTPQSSERKRGFKMSAFEDFADMDDDVPLSEATGVEKSVKMSKSIASEVSSEKNPVLSQVKTHPVPLVFKKSEVDTSNASTEATEKATPASDPPLAESFGLKNTESVVPPTESKPEKPSSLMNTKSTDTTANGELGTVPISTNNFFSTGASNIFSNNGNIGSTTSSAFAPISESKNPINSSSSFISSTGTTAISNTDSNTVASNVAPVTPGPFSAISQVTTTGNSETTGLKENGFGKLGNFSTFGTDLSGAGSKVFGTSSTSVAASESSIMTQGTGSSLSMPIQFGSSSSPTLFTAPPSGITSFTSSVPATSTATATVSDSSASTSQTNTFKYGSLESNTTTTTTPGVFPFNSTSSSASQSVTGNGIFNFGGTTFPANSGTGTVTSTTSAPSVFNFGGSKPASSSETTTTTTTTMFSSGWPASNSPSPAFVSSTFCSTPVGFGMNNTTSSTPVFSFPSMAAPTTTSPSPTTQPIFGANSPNPFATSATNKDPMSPDDNSMAEDRQSPAAPAASLFGQSAPAPAVSLFGQSAAAQAGSLFGQSPATPAAAPFGQSSPAAQGFGAQSPTFNFGSQAPAPAFGQAPISPSPPGFMFNSNVQSPAPTFQFGGQQGQPSPQTPGQFQATGSLDFNAGGSFSLGSGAPDKSNRRIVKPNRNRLKKK